MRFNFTDTDNNNKDQNITPLVIALNQIVVIGYFFCAMAVGAVLTKLFLSPQFDEIRSRLQFFLERVMWSMNYETVRIETIRLVIIDAPRALLSRSPRGVARNLNEIMHLRRNVLVLEDTRKSNSPVESST